MALQLPTTEAVRAIIRTDLTDGQVGAVIGDAALFAEGCPKVAGYDGTRQAAIIKWITAHMIASTNAGGGSLTQKALGDASETYARPTLGLGLQGTSYGQQAIALDPSGCLSRLGAMKAHFRAI